MGSSDGYSQKYLHEDHVLFYMAQAAEIELVSMVL